MHNCANPKWEMAKFQRIAKRVVSSKPDQSKIRSVYGRTPRKSSAEFLALRAHLKKSSSSSGYLNGQKRSSKCTNVLERLNQLYISGKGFVAEIQFNSIHKEQHILLFFVSVLSKAKTMSNVDMTFFIFVAKLNVSKS